MDVRVCEEKMLESKLALEAKLGLTYTKAASTFQVWAPSQDQVSLCLYKDGQGGRPLEFPMKKEGGLHRIQIPGNWDGRFYTYKIGSVETTDPYSIAAGVNSGRSAIVDLASTDPEGFREETFLGAGPGQAILYELHVGDFLFSPQVGSKYPGKYLSLTERGLNYQGLFAGIDHLKELGVNYVHLMPIADFWTVDERPERFGQDSNYNWGYDPELLNVPEGSYATDPYDPKSRIREFKRLVQALHRAGIGVIMDVVYNHTYKTFDSNFNLLVPNYYYRQRQHMFSNGSGVGNEIASEKPMVRKFILESLAYWQKEYQIDGFRMDLMALLDIDTMTQAYQLLKSRNPHFLFYGEPWAGGDSALDRNKQTTWGSQVGRGFALFNEQFRKAIRGDNDGYSRGYVQGATEYKKDLETGLLGSIHYQGIRDGGLDSPLSSINYFNAHDNLILEDKLTRSMGNREHNEAMTKFAFAILLTAQGIPFFHAGNEFRRTKQMDPNSYRSPYFINAIDWSLKKENKGLYNYVRALIALRKKYPSFRLETQAEIEEKIQLLETGHPDVVAILHKTRPGEGYLCLYHNGWKDIVIDGDFIYQALGALELSVQRIFDNHGAVEVNRLQLLRSQRTGLCLDPLSFTVINIKKLR